MLIQKVENELGGWKLEAGKPLDPVFVESLKTYKFPLADSFGTKQLED